jgi:hypothetical protein
MRQHLRQLPLQQRQRDVLRQALVFVSALQHVL